jgi:hypothetical protein
MISKKQYVGYLLSTPFNLIAYSKRSQARLQQL